MDENKEKELLEENGINVLSEEEAQKVSNIVEELKNAEKDSSESVKDWDGLAEVGANNDTIIEEKAEPVSEEKAQDELEDEGEEEELCIRCEKRERYTEIEEDYPYCKVCREEMKKTRMNPLAVISLILTALVAFFALVWGVWAIAISIPVIKGDSLMRKGDNVAAAKCYMEAITSVDTLSAENADTEGIFDVGNKTYEKLETAFKGIVSEKNKKGDECVKAKKYQSAINYYIDSLTEVISLASESSSEATFNSINSALADTYAKIIRAYALSGSPANAGMVTVGQSQLDCYAQLEALDVLDKEEYADIKEYYDLYNGMMNTYGVLTQQVYTSVLDNLYADMDKDKNKLEDVKKYLDELEKYKSDSQFDKYMVSYVQSIFCAMTTDGASERAKYLEQVKQGGGLYEFIYAQELCIAYLDMGENAKAEALCHESYENSPENHNVYQFLMKSKIRQGDYDGAIALAEKVEKEIDGVYLGSSAEEGSTAMPHTVLMEKAIAHALKGEKDKALAAIDLSYQIGNDNSNLNIYLLLHYLYHVKGTEPTTDEDGNKVYDNVDGAYDEAELTINTYGSYYGLSLSDNIEAIIDGKKTLEDVFVKGEVEW